MRSYDKMIIDLQGLKAYASGVPDRPYPGGAELINEVLYCLNSYCEPWVCPDCGNTLKIPEDHKRVCNSGEE